MPVEIRELVIRVVATAAENESEAEANDQAIDRESLIQECVRQVLNILKRKEER